MLGHVGDGNVHIGSTFVPESPEQVERARSFQEEAIRLALSLGGTLTAEHGVGLWKAPYLEEEHGPALELMRSLKRLLDPQGILNPGKMALEGIPRVALMERWWREG
jgi:FAD/FMN-containing dehydrogenase